MTENLKLITLRVNAKQLKRLEKGLGVDSSKAIRASMNVADFVIHELFKGQVTNIFLRRRDDETQNRYEKL